MIIIDMICFKNVIVRMAKIDDVCLKMVLIKGFLLFVSSDIRCTVINSSYKMMIVS
jgi:hypothetical protein